VEKLITKMFVLDTFEYGVFMPGDRWSCGGELPDRVSARGNTDFTDFSLKLRAYVYAARRSPPSKHTAAEPLHRAPTTAMYSVIQTE
jgi:hypothetical protein